MNLRLRRVVPLLAAGAAGIVGGGIAAAVTGPTDWQRGSWVAAYLVLVVGVGQIVLGAGQGYLAVAAPPRRAVTVEWLLYNASAVLVIVGTLTHHPLVVAAGSVVLLAALVMFAIAVPLSAERHRLGALLYRAVLVILIVSTPVGVILSLVRS